MNLDVRRGQAGTRNKQQHQAAYNFRAVPAILSKASTRMAVSPCCDKSRSPSLPTSVHDTSTVPSAAHPDGNRADTSIACHRAVRVSHHSKVEFILCGNACAVVVAVRTAAIWFRVPHTSGMQLRRAYVIGASCDVKWARSHSACTVLAACCVVSVCRVRCPRVIRRGEGRDRN